MNVIGHLVLSHQSIVHQKLSLLIYIVLSHRPSYHVQSIVLLFSLFLYHHNFTITLFSRINSINTNLIFSYSFLPFHLLPSHIFFLLFWICYWSALPSSSNLQQEQLVSHINRYFIYSACRRLSPLLVYLFVFEHMNDISHLNIFIGLY
jgi:hypothetical protein